MHGIGGGIGSEVEFTYFNHWGIDHQIGSIIKIPQELKPMAETSYIQLINFLYPT